MTGSKTDPSAQLFVEHGDRLRRYARQLVGTNTDADDLVQETFLKAHSYLQNGNVIRAPLSFLFVTVRNLANDDYRQKKIRLADSTDVDTVAPDGHASSVESEVVSDEEYQGLCAAVAKLPPRMHEVFVLRKVYGYSCREIAEMLELSINTVRELVARSFKRVVAHQNGEEEPQQLDGRMNGSRRLLRIVPAPNHE